MMRMLSGKLLVKYQSYVKIFQSHWIFIDDYVFVACCRM